MASESFALMVRCDVTVCAKYAGSCPILRTNINTLQSEAKEKPSSEVLLLL